MPRGEWSGSPADAVVTPAKAIRAASSSVFFIVLLSFCQLRGIRRSCSDFATPQSRISLTDVSDPAGVEMHAGEISEAKETSELVARAIYGQV